MGEKKKTNRNQSGAKFKRKKMPRSLKHIVILLALLTFEVGSFYTIFITQ